VYIAHLYAAYMANFDTRRLLLEIDASADIQHYLKGACDELLEIIHLMCVCTCVQAGTAPSLSRHNASPVLRSTEYQHSWQYFMKLGTTQNHTHPGSVKNKDIDGVFTHGNIRERCALLMNMLCHDKTFLIMQWVLERAPTAAQEPNAGVQPTSLSNTTSGETASGMIEGGVDMHSRAACMSLMPSSVNISQVVAYKRTLTRSTDKMRTTSVDPDLKKDTCKALCKLVNCPHENTRAIRPLYLQHKYALSFHDIVPGLSLRERDLMREAQNRPPLAMLSDTCFLDLAPWPIRPTSSTAVEANGENKGKHCCSRACVRHAPAMQADCITQNRCAATCAVKVLPQTADYNATSRGYNDLGILPWLTGHMCWTMIHDSTFFIHGCRRGEDMVAGPSGHTHALMTFMRIFKNFDVCKWTLICVVWLVGADHHTVYEVLVAAIRHGLPYNPESNSVEFTRTLLRTVFAAHRKTVWGLNVAK